MRNDVDLRAVPGLRRLIRIEQYDIVHFHTKRAHALSLWLPRGSKPRYVVTRRMDYPERRGWYTDCLYNRRVDGVVAISRVIANLLIQAGVDGGKIRCIPSGIDPRRFAESARQKPQSTGVQVIGCLAGLDERKGHEYLLQAAASLKADGLKLCYKIAGDGPLRHSLEQQASRLGLQDEVSFLGFVADPAEFLAQVDVLVMPSLYEGLGVAVLEAMAAGKAVIATRVGGLPESIVEGVTGLLVPPRDAGTLAEAIAKLVHTPALAAAMGEQGRARVLQDFTLEKMATENESYYYELLGASA
jgi:glycosyltransferase involved in cell wall biosynthesis